MPYFTILMPTYQQARFIEDALFSIFNQDCKDFELLVYDAESGDGTREILEKYRHKLTWIREKDKGMSDAINKGFAAGKGEVFAWLNSDDMYLPGAFSRIRDVFEKNPNIEFIYGDVLEMDVGGKIMRANTFTEYPDARRYLHSNNYICQPTAFFRKRIFDSAGTLDDGLQLDMDYEWFARIHMANRPMMRIPYFLAANRNHAETKTNASGARRYKNMLGILRRRPGPMLPFRKSFWVYTLEACAKAVLAKANSFPEQAILHKALYFCFWLVAFIPRKLVHSGDKKDIVRRYETEIRPLGKTVREIWESARGKESKVS